MAFYDCVGTLLNTLDLALFAKKDIIIHYMLIIILFRLGGLVIAAKILALVRCPGNT